jgi:hypothetical protein
MINKHKTMKVQIANPNLADEIIASLLQQNPAINTPEFIALRLLNRRWQCANYNQDGEPWLRITNYKDLQVINDLFSKYPDLLVVVPSDFLESVADEKIGLLSESELSYCRKQAEILESTKSLEKSKQHADALWRIASNVIELSQLGETLTPEQQNLCRAIGRNILLQYHTDLKV